MSTTEVRRKRRPLLSSHKDKGTAKRQYRRHRQSIRHVQWPVETLVAHARHAGQCAQRWSATAYDDDCDAMAYQWAREAGTYARMVLERLERQELWR
jgi:hypothetical protein